MNTTAIKHTMLIKALIGMVKIGIDLKWVMELSENYLKKLHHHYTIVEHMEQDGLMIPILKNQGTLEMQRLAFTIKNLYAIFRQIFRLGIVVLISSIFYQILQHVI